MAVHPDEALLVKLRQRQQTPHGRARLREPTKVEHSLAISAIGKAATPATWAPPRTCSTSGGPRSSTTSTSSPASHPSVNRPHDYLADALDADQARQFYLERVQRQQLVHAAHPDLRGLLGYDPRWAELAGPNDADQQRQASGPEAER